MSPDLLVTADDRTGALETAGVIADAGLGSVLVRVLPRLHGGSTAAGAPGAATVIDVDTRHRPPEEAAAIVRELHAADGAWWHGHKIDSTLRGPWSFELAALSEDRRVLLVPAFPAAGRTCRSGVVLVDGIPVHESAAGRDPRAPVRSSRPLDHLRSAGLRDDEVSLLAAGEVAEWLRHGRTRVAVVAEVRDEATVAEAVGGWHAAGDAGGVLVGPAGVHTASAALLAGSPRGRAPVQAPKLGPSVLVVVGSAHPVARAQLAAVEAAGLAGVSVCATAEPGPEPVEASAHLQRLLEQVHAVRATRAPSTLVLVGGETAAGVLGEAGLLVHGTLATGMAWGRVVVGGVEQGPVVVTKPGGFGDRDTLVRLLRERMG